MTDILMLAATLMDYIDSKTSPADLDMQEALEVLEELQGDLEARIDGLCSDLGLD